MHENHEENEDDIIVRGFLKHFHIGNFVTLGASLITVGITWGTLNSDIKDIREDVDSNSKQLQDQQGPPGVNRRISMVELTDIQIQKELNQQRSEMLETRRELKAQLDRIEDKIDDRK